MSRLKTLLKNEDGQALTEYFLVAYSILIGLLVIWQFVGGRFIRAFQFYIDVFYAIMNLPIP
jgi:Flp pilus assembly pilin Flp